MVFNNAQFLVLKLNIRSQLSAEFTLQGNKIPKNGYKYVSLKQ